MGNANGFVFIGGFLVLVVGGYLAYNYIFKGNLATANQISASTVAQNQALTFFGSALGAGAGSYIAAQGN